MRHADKLLLLVLTVALLWLPLQARAAAEPPEPVDSDEDVQDADDDSEAADLGSSTIHARRPLTAASQRAVRDRDFLLNPRQSASDLMSVVPQLYISQHSGGGKGHQVFLRGFDAEHGDDAGVYLEGVPLNQPSHAHGIGYTDLHFLIPEAIERMDVLKGPYEPRFGDFSTAGAVDFRVKERVDESMLELKGGSFHSYQGTLLTSLPTHDVDTLLALQGTTTEGFTEAGDWKAFRALMSVGIPVGPDGLVRFLYAGYGSDWNAADAIPAPAVAAGDLGFYGAVDDTDGGDATRHHMSLHLRLPVRAGFAFDARAYLVRSTTRVFSNYTYYAEFPERGDQTEQADDRWTYGLGAEALLSHHFGDVLLETTVGGGVRGDTVAMNVWRTTRRKRWDSAAGFDFLIHDFSAFARLELVPADWVRVIAGARLDYVLFDVEGMQDFQRPSGALDEDQPIQGIASRLVPQPKATVVFSPLPELDLFLNFGTGFHSPDARDPVRNRDETIPLAYAAEVGVRARLWDRLDLAAAVWGAYLEQETFFDPLLGRSVDQGQSRRIGADLELRLEILDWLWTSLDLGFTDARLIDTEEDVPGSPAWMGSLRVHVRHPLGIRAGARVRYVGRRALAEGHYGEDAWLLDVLVEYRWRFLALGISVENALAMRWKDAQFYYASRWRAADSSDPAPAHHFTAGTPIAARGWLKLFF